ncbi:MAG: transposase [Acidobacteria bacterium]|nr:MAG: transposase [Acidobacteriota bacterium]
MAEVGLLAFARIALEVGRAVLPPYRTRFSKHQFIQPQLLAILCLMRYEDWTFREAEVRLSEHGELRQVLGLKSVPDFTTLYRFLRRLESQTIERAVGETVRRMSGGRPCRRRRARVAVDATGLAQGAVSTYFVRRLHHHGQKALPWRHLLKWLVVADLDQQLLLSQRARPGPWNDCGSLSAVVHTASRQTRIGLVLADAEFDSERNHAYIRQRLGAHSVIPAKRGKKTWRVRGVRAEMRRAFPTKLYRRRALIETLFSSVKRKLSARAPGRSLRTQTLQALLLGLSFNLYRLRHRYIFLRMSTEPSTFWCVIKLGALAAKTNPLGVRSLHCSTVLAVGIR